MAHLGVFSPMPSGCTREYAEKCIRAAFQEQRAQAVIDFIRPSVRIWPKASAGNLLASRFGGLPAVPRNWNWPVPDDEQIVFVGQINCAEVYAQVGATPLPKSGMLSFFGGCDEVNGCGPSHEGFVYYFPNLDAMTLAKQPRADFTQLISCDLSFYRNMEIPHPESLKVGSLNLTKDERDTYYDLVEATAQIGFPKDWHSLWISKLLGWPDFVQHEFDDPYNNTSKSDLLLQIGWYPNGTTFEGWGPGGTLYFTLERQHLAAGQFELARLQVQCT